MFVNKLRYKPHLLGNFKTEKLLTDQSAIPSYLRKSSSFAGDVKVSRLHVYQLNTKKHPLIHGAEQRLTATFVSP